MNRFQIQNVSTGDLLPFGVDGAGSHSREAAECVLALQEPGVYEIVESKPEWSPQDVLEYGSPRMLVQLSEREDKIRAALYRKLEQTTERLRADHEEFSAVPSATNWRLLEQAMLAHQSTWQAVQDRNTLARQIDRKMKAHGIV